MIDKNEIMPPSDNMLNLGQDWDIKEYDVLERADTEAIKPFDELVLDESKVCDDFGSGAVGLKTLFNSVNESNNKTITQHTETINDSHQYTKLTKDFIKLLRATKFEDGEYNEAYDYFENVKIELGVNFSEWIAGVCRDYIDDDDIVVKLLTIFADYDFDQLSSVQSWIIIANINNRSNAVKSAALNIIDSWHNNEALSFLNHFEIPKEPWLRLKYNTIKKDLENVLHP